MFADWRRWVGIGVEETGSGLVRVTCVSGIGLCIFRLGASRRLLGAEGQGTC